MIVLEDADLERCVNGAIYGAFLNSGQVCSGVKRIYVHETIYKEFLQRFKEKTEKLKQGYGWDDTEVSMGPLINEEAVKEMEKQIERAKEQGAKILTGGKRNSNLKGNFFEPSILINVVQKMDVVKKEIFGPIVPVLSFSTDEEAIDLANDTSFGLYGSVWTNDLKRGEKIAQRLTMGTIAINNHTYTYGIPHTPWGGNKNSGYGRTHGRFGFEELIQTQHIHLDNQRIKSDSWWQPYNSKKVS
jgi:succinate-semialdehyde dehydrogenase/glutarate-semialdehyde dehydrogenase